MTELFKFPTNMQRQARISECGRYRYLLWRTWQDWKPKICWVMLNPSTADHTKDDPTIRKCIKFSKAWGYGGLIVVNLFAYRSSKPVDLLGVEDPVGPDNDECIRLATFRCTKKILGWGNVDRRLQWRTEEVLERMKKLHENPQCLGVTKIGQPRHPLYIKDSFPPIPFNIRSDTEV